jgi:hypothetical protein
VNVLVRRDLNFDLDVEEYIIREEDKVKKIFSMKVN